MISGFCRSVNNIFALFCDISNILKPTVGHEKLHELGNDNGVIINISTLKNLSIPMFSHWNIHKYM